MDRVLARLKELDDPELWAWLEEWSDAFTEAIESEGEGEEQDELIEDLAIALLVFERTRLRPPGRMISADEFIRELGFGPELLGDEAPA